MIVAPGQAERGLHGIIVPLNPGHEAFEFSNPALARFLHPGTQALRLFLTNHFLESLEQGMNALDFL
jgi:hypothetical protein